MRIVSLTGNNWMTRCPVAAAQSISLRRSGNSPVPKSDSVRSENNGSAVPAPRHAVSDAMSGRRPATTMRSPAVGTRSQRRFGPSSHATGRRVRRSSRTNLYSNGSAPSSRIRQRGNRGRRAPRSAPSRPARPNCRRRPASRRAARPVPRPATPHPRTPSTRPVFGTDGRRSPA